ncbi:MAG: hypothetical protein QM401_00730 [Bacillota bacterium]|nr:hypothetical protein [Bacillota bacterium]
MSTKINVFAVSNVRHNRKDYKPGDEIPRLKKEDRERLEALGAVRVEEVAEKSAPPPDDLPPADPPTDDPPQNNSPKNPEKDKKGEDEKDKGKK